MYRQLISLTMALFVAVPLLFSTTALAKHKSNPCKSSAYSMLRACGYDVRDDLNETSAICRNIGDGSDRRQCFKDAYAEARDEREVCGDQYVSRKQACRSLDEYRYDPDPLLDPARSFIDPDDIPDMYDVNPYVSLEAGHTFVQREGEETIVVHVTDESREILGVLCRVVVDIVVEVEGEGDEVEYEAVEATDDWFGQDTSGNVYYCGEVARNYDDGVLRDLDGSFEAGYSEDGESLAVAKSGELVRAFPVVGDTHRQEYLLGEAEDIILYVDTATAPTEEEGGDNDNFPCAPNSCLKTYEYNPLEPESTEFKYYLPGTGFVLGVAMEDGDVTGDRDELVCVGDSLDILADPACEIDDPEALVEALCELSPGTFCADDDDD